METWIPRVVWYDNLDVLGSDEFQQRPGLHYDPTLQGFKLIEFLERTYGNDVVALVQWAREYEAAGFPFAAQVIRDRAAAVTAFLDPHLLPYQRDQVHWYLQIETRPTMLMRVARSYEDMGFPRAGAAIRDRAALLRLARRSRAPSPEIVWPWPNSNP